MSQFKKIVIALFSLSIPLSKSGIPLFGGLLLLASFALLATQQGRSRWQQVWRNYSFAIILGLSPIWGMAFSAFSLEAAEATPKFFEHLHMPILLLVMLFWFDDDNDRKTSLNFFGVGMAISCIYGIYIFFTEHEGIYDSDLRLASTWDVSRWGLVLMTSLILLVVARVDRSELKLSNKYIDSFLLGIVPVCLILNNSRAPWLFGFIALFLYILMIQRKYILPFVLASAVVLAAGLQFSPSFRARVATIANFKNSDGGATSLQSSDPSNQARLTMWKVAWKVMHKSPWFGTGLEHSENLTRAAVEELKREQTGFIVPRELSYRDQHSSYLTLLVQTGLFFTIAFLGLIVFSLIQGLQISLHISGDESSHTSERNHQKQKDWGILVAMVMFLMCAIVYSELVSLGSYFFWYLLGLWLKPWRQTKLSK
jgi:hypothetical protein